jgi:hypothetical protein
MLHSKLRVLLVIALVSVVGIVALKADSGANHQVRTQFFGSSGGNVNNIGPAFCCSGTLGSLVEDSSGMQYILSNNHVLADTDQAAPGDDISQPGLVDNSCKPATTVANFTTAPKLGTSNVDAAIAELVAGTMDSGGSILDIGVPNSTTVSATINMVVAKSGRTTGLTCGPVQSLNTTVKVQYQKGCNQGRKFTVTYTNQVVVGGSGFSAGGDSGSLIVSQTAAHPTALLYAGSSTTTIGNPIGEVLTRVGTSLGKPVSFVGDPNRSTDVTCPTQGGAPSGTPGRPSEATLNRASVVKEHHLGELMVDPAVMAVGVGASEENPSEAVVVIYVETGRAHAAIPAGLDGVRTQTVRTDRIRAYSWNEPERSAIPKSCSLK